MSSPGEVTKQGPSVEVCPVVVVSLLSSWFVRIIDEKRLSLLTTTTAIVVVFGETLHFKYYIRLDVVLVRLLAGCSVQNDSFQ